MRSLTKNPWRKRNPEGKETLERNPGENETLKRNPGCWEDRVPMHVNRSALPTCIVILRRRQQEMPAVILPQLMCRVLIIQVLSMQDLMYTCACKDDSAVKILGRPDFSPERKSWPMLFSLSILLRIGKSLAKLCVHTYVCQCCYPYLLEGHRSMRRIVTSCHESSRT